MSRQRWIVSALVLILVAGVSFAVSSAISSRQCAVNAQCPTGQGLGVCMVTGYLGLTPEQEAKTAPLADRFCQAQQAGGERARAARQKLLAALKAPHTDRGDVDAALAELTAVQSELQRQTADYLLELKPILTQAQEQKLFDLVSERFCGRGKCATGAGRGMGGTGCGMQRGCLK